jgi:hypothetical protein
MSARLEEAQLPYHGIVCRQVARENDIARCAIYLPEFPQASGRGAANACPVSHAFAEAADIIAASTTAV